MKWYQRTFEQDPKYAIRLLVDIAIGLCRRRSMIRQQRFKRLTKLRICYSGLGQRFWKLESTGTVTVSCAWWFHFPRGTTFFAWPLMSLFYGATSVQVLRRMNALVADLSRAVPKERRPAIESLDVRLKSHHRPFFCVDSEERLAASKQDRQGLGTPRQHSSANEEDWTRYSINVIEHIQVFWP